MTKGGQREGAGAPTKIDKKVPYSTRLPPSLVEKLKKHDLPAAKIIERALLDWFAR